MSAKTKPPECWDIGCGLVHDKKGRHPPKRCYLAGPMRGIEEYNFPAFMAADEFLSGVGWVVVNPAQLDLDLGFDPEIDEPMSQEAYMKRDLPLVAACDAIALLPGWENSTGAKNEYHVALLCGLDVISAVDAETLTAPYLDIILRRNAEQWRREPDEEPESPLFEAHRIVHAERGAAYGPPAQDFERTGRMWGAILDIDDVEPRKVALCMIALKLSREAYQHKRDNLVDIGGFDETLAMIEHESA